MNAGTPIPAGCAGGTPALIGFVGNSGLWWLRLLRPGFRHCFVALRDAAGWVVIDPLSHHTMIRVETTDNLADHYRAHGITVVETHTRPPPHRPAPWRPYTCVEEVKRILGIRADLVLTPWQLYRWLQKKENSP